MEELSTAQDMDQRFFWYLVNKNKKNKSAGPIFDEKRELLTDPNRIREEWNKYYQDLYSDKKGRGI